jgi:hypothetical protein
MNKNNNTTNASAATTAQGIIRSILDFPNAARWSSAKPVWNEGRADSLKFVYESRGEFLAYSARFGYAGPFTTMETAILAA